MSEPCSIVPKAKLIVGLLFQEGSFQRRTLDAMCKSFGPLDFLSEPAPFTFTTYYDREMGAGLTRQLGSFLRLVSIDILPDVKLLTNELEQRFSLDGKRRINIDPGVLSEERLILATGKNFTHRVYLRDGIYADLTLIYQNGAYQILPWTYPDYRESGVRHFLSILRKKFRYQTEGFLPRKV
jgi:hypothetical protein